MSGETRKRVRVLIVDDSALVRGLLSAAFQKDPALEVIGTAADPYTARNLLVRMRPDVMTLDIEMPRMDGIAFLQRFMVVAPTPTVIFSAFTATDPELARRALQVGAVAVVCKPALGVLGDAAQRMSELICAVKAAAAVDVRAPRGCGGLPTSTAAAVAKRLDQVIGIGASMGGVAALGRLLPQLPASAPGVVVVQHMAAGFTRGFAERLDYDCAVRVSEARDGVPVLPGHVLIAPGGDRHCEVREADGSYCIQLVKAPPVSGHLPSVDVFFESLAKWVGAKAVGCLLTGMGADGARGLLAMRRRGARTFGQSRKSCAVWGMPAAALALGAVEQWVDLDGMALALVGACAL